LTTIVVLVGYAMPKYYDAFIPVERRREGAEPTTAMEIKGEVARLPVSEIAHGEVRDSSSDQDHKVIKETPPAYHTISLRA
jgi:solute carrier family 6 GABA transporter-like protein 1